MNLKDKKILITGGSGFVGMNLITRLQKEGANVENYDISNSNRIENSKNLLENEFNCSIEIYIAESSSEKKANNAMPGKPAILIE